MESAGRDDLPEISQMVELTSDAIAVCGSDGTIGHVNRRLRELIGLDRDRIVGTDIKDLMFSEAFERASGHGLPFPADGEPVTLMLKLFDGSFIPVEVKATSLAHHHDELRRRFLKRLKPRERVLVVVRSLEEEYAHDRQMRRVLSELQAANKRLSGTLSVIMATVGATDLPGLLDSVLNKIVDALDADGTTIYFSESNGFKLRGVSRSLARSFVPEFIPYGAGVPTYVLRESRPCRFSVVPASENGLSEGYFYDLDKRERRPLRSQDMPPFKTMIAVPVFFGRQVLGIMELGWGRHTTPRMYDVSVLEVICDYLSIELMSLVSSLRSQRSAELTRSLNSVRDAMYSLEDDRGAIWAEVTHEIRRVLACHVCPIVADAATGRMAIDYEGGSLVRLPDDIESLFFSVTAPAARVNPAMEDYFSDQDDPYGIAEGDLQAARITRVDAHSKAGEWLAFHGLPCQGVFVDFTEDGSLPAAPARDAAAADRDLSAGEGAPDAAGPLATVADAAPIPPRMLLILRDGTQEPISDIEYDYLVRLVHDYELLALSSEQHQESQHIAQTLQVGMRSSLGSVPGITADSLYSSATRQALVGGDFYTLMRLPDNQAVMILGDVSGKGVEAASMSALVKTALTAYAWEGASPVRMVRALNSMLMSFSRVETFATMFVAKIDLSRGAASYCSAGHPPSMLVRTAAGAGGSDAPGSPGAPGASVREVELLSVQSGVVGAFEGMVFESGTFRFRPGDVLFMYTDGAIEARSPEGDFFGEQRLRDILLESVGDGVEGLCERVLAELDAFCESALEDDIALVALRFDG